MKFIFSLMVLGLVGTANAAQLKAVIFKSVACQISQNNQMLREVTQPLMLLQIDDGFGRFAQIQFGNENLKMQYQLLIEDDSAVKGNVIVLQNWLVGEREVSEEVSVEDVSSVAVANEGYSVKCEISK
ncbi:hypothetical protein [Bdellovibrio sp. HCB2-146]|uniref:hypothetical protein n=1 Tax=Bdellovibrio sp. HCB2-146 TaxID=3394362 RepID=UPI0039BD6DB2